MSVQYIRIIVNNQTELTTLANMLVSPSLVQQGFNHHFIPSQMSPWSQVAVVPNVLFKTMF